MSGAVSDFALVGVGGAAARFVSKAALAHPGLRAVCFDCDAATGEAAPGAAFTLLGQSRLDGRGSGGDAVASRTAVRDDTAIVRESLSGVRLAVVAVSLGGGFGSGATPEILRVLRDSGIVTLCVALKPFSFEGGDRAATARRAIPLVEDSANAVAPVALDDLFADAASMPVDAAFEAVSATMSDILSLLWRMAATPGFISLGVERIASIISSSSGRARLAVAKSEGNGRAAAAAAALLASRLPGAEAKLENAESAILGVAAGQDLRLSELSEISAAFTARIPAPCRLDFGVIVDDSLSGSLSLASIVFEKGLAATAEPVAQGDKPHSAKRGSRRDPLAIGAAGTRFKGTDGTIYNGQDLDVPTYLRRNIQLEK